MHVTCTSHAAKSPVNLLFPAFHHNEVSITVSHYNMEVLKKPSVN